MKAALSIRPEALEPPEFQPIIKVLNKLRCVFSKCNLERDVGSGQLCVLSVHVSFV